MLKSSAGAVELVKKAISVVAVYNNFPLWFIDRLHILPRKKILYKLRNGVNFAVESRTLDSQFINEMFVDNQYTCLSGLEISPTDIVLDLGAHKGIFTVFAAKHAYAGKVISYEASPITYQYFQENIDINKVKNVTSFNAAVGTSDGTTTFYLAEDPGCNMIVPKNGFPEVDQKNIISVPEVSFERIMEELHHVDFLKMDVEGMEFPILMNCSQASLRKVKRIGLEYHPESGSVDSLIKHLEGVGFQTSLWKERRILYAWREQEEAVSKQPDLN